MKNICMVCKKETGDQSDACITYGICGACGERLIERSVFPMVSNDGSFVTICANDHHEYEIEFELCNTPDKAVKWVYHLAQKNWCTPKLISRFLEACKIPLHPCGKA